MNQPPVVWKFPGRVWKDVKTGRTHIINGSSSPWGTKGFRHLGHPVPA